MAMGETIFRAARFFDKCRRKRNIADYDAAGRITEAEAKELCKRLKSIPGPFSRELLGVGQAYSVKYKYKKLEVRQENVCVC